jgi:hypothetical protein
MKGIVDRVGFVDFLDCGHAFSCFFGVAVRRKRAVSRALQLAQARALRTL